MVSTMVCTTPIIIVMYSITAQKLVSRVNTLGTPTRT